MIHSHLDHSGKRGEQALRIECQRPITTWYWDIGGRSAVSLILPPEITFAIVPPEISRVRESVSRRGWIN